MQVVLRVDGRFYRIDMCDISFRQGFQFLIFKCFCRIFGRQQFVEWEKGQKSGGWRVEFVGLVCFNVESFGDIFRFLCFFFRYNGRFKGKRIKDFLGAGRQLGVFFEWYCVLVIYESRVLYTDLYWKFLCFGCVYVFNLYIFIQICFWFC